MIRTMQQQENAFPASADVSPGIQSKLRGILHSKWVR